MHTYMATNNRYLKGEDLIKKGMGAKKRPSSDLQQFGLDLKKKAIEGLRSIRLGKKDGYYKTMTLGETYDTFFK